MLPFVVKEPHSVLPWPGASGKGGAACPSSAGTSTGSWMTMTACPRSWGTGQIRRSRLETFAPEVLGDAPGRHDSRLRSGQVSSRSSLYEHGRQRAPRSTDHSWSEGVGSSPLAPSRH
eukprot:5797496-Pyramimonas_sp.AAC.1